MPLALILSSYVAASRVGGFPQALVLAQWKVDPVLAPTVLFGRRPGQGSPPGGGPVDAVTFKGVLEGIAGRGLLGLADVVITGYFADEAQVVAAAELIGRVRAAPREGAFSARPFVLVDPIMGDEPEGLYVSEAVARAVTRELVPRADVLTPNLWELGRLTGSQPRSPAEAAAAAQGLGRPTLVTSVPVGPDEIGGVFLDGGEAQLFAHERVTDPPNGTGDVVAAVLAARMIDGEAAADAAESAVCAAAETVLAAREWSAPELPIVALGERLRKPTAPVRVERLG